MLHYDLCNLMCIILYKMCVMCVNDFTIKIILNQTQTQPIVMINPANGYIHLNQSEYKMKQKKTF